MIVDGIDRGDPGLDRKFGNLACLPEQERSRRDDQPAKPVPHHGIKSGIDFRRRAGLERCDAHARPGGGGLREIRHHRLERAGSQQERHAG